MPTNREHYRNILQFWRSAEIFTLPDIPTSKRKDSRIFTPLKPDGPLPWEDDTFPVPAAEKQWKHTLYFHVVAKEAVVELLAGLCGSAEFREPVFGQTCLSALVLNQQGQPAERSYSPAAFVYGIKILREKGDPEELMELLRKAQEDYMERFQVPVQTAEHGGGGAASGGATSENGGASSASGNGETAGSKRVDRVMLRKELELLRRLVQNKLTTTTPVLCVSEQVSVGAVAEAPFLNSYFLNDLNTLIADSTELGQPLEMFLSPEVNTDARVNLLQHRPLLESLHPQQMPAGRWPSHPAHGLYSAQQAALNITLTNLRDGGGEVGRSCRRSSGLLGINGPPGTGKTTLLREVIADVVVNRAERLLKSDVERLFAAARTPIVDALGYYPINRAVAGNDGIVVSSNNNTAIENISRELPALKSIHRETFAEADYFSTQAAVLYDEPCWGMLSATLGKAENRNGFVSGLWYKHGSFRHFLREQYDDPVQRVRNKENYSSTARELTALLKEYEEFRAVAVAYHDALLQEVGQAGKLQALGTTLVTDWGILPADLPDRHFMELSTAEIQRLVPYSSERVNTL